MSVGVSLFAGSKSDSSSDSVSSNNNCRPTLQLSIILQPHTEEPKAVSPDDIEVKNFMTSYINTLFTNSNSLTVEKKSAFGKHVQKEAGQTWFARIINSQRVRWRCVTETTFYSLVQHFAIVLFECANLDHFAPAKTLMNMCFTFYHEVEVPGCEPFREYLSTYLRTQPIWQSLRFWNAAFFDALQCARIQKPVLTQNEILQSDADAILDEKQYQENITFGLLGTFICNMHAFGLDKSLCEEFLQKQYVIASLPSCQKKMLQEHMHNLYSETSNVE